jgi:hypothetical protein
MQIFEVFFLVLKHVQFYYGSFLLQNKLTIKFEARQCIDIKVICKVNQTQKFKNFQHIPKIGIMPIWHFVICYVFQLPLEVNSMASITSFTQSSEVRHDWVGQEQVRVMHLWEQQNYERKFNLILHPSCTKWKHAIHVNTITKYTYIIYNVHIGNTFDIINISSQHPLNMINMNLWPTWISST